MPDILKRLAVLTEEQRAQLLQQLKARHRRAERTVHPNETSPTTESPLLLDELTPSEPSAIKASYKRFYDSVTVQLNGSVFAQFSYFLNYGYLADGSPEYSVVSLPPQYINKNSVKLVLEVIGNCSIGGKRVLDVGCGRGGTIHTLKTFFKPASLTGLDLSSEAVAFDQKVHGDAQTRFHEGDAEQLPFPDASFDVVTNVESSHSYPHIDRFYAEVTRVLTPGGYFLYTDALPVPQITSSLGYLAYLGFDIEQNRNITANVLKSCDEVSVARVQAFDQRNDRQLMQNFLATPGSQVYENLRAGRWEYRILKCKKRILNAGQSPWPGSS
jgi:ubiquinone/menaquinone biosynthesis C-methylase UbiE